ncbi:hypothetical protein SDC9_139556 [bioreactor metagenome]|uniref:Uncharacterized protein n=1 Tax=bioreactor metagenome TaxID=1076179 RepID=A0A645DSX6_9ZZZZ
MMSRDTIKIGGDMFYAKESKGRGRQDQAEMGRFGAHRHYIGYNAVQLFLYCGSNGICGFDHAG